MGASAVFATFAPDTDYFGPTGQAFMVNLRVDDLDGCLEAVAAAGGLGGSVGVSGRGDAFEADRQPVRAAVRVGNWDGSGDATSTADDREQDSRQSAA